MSKKRCLVCGGTVCDVGILHRENPIGETPSVWICAPCHRVREEPKEHKIEETSLTDKED
jgi:hypothetical protein